MERYNKDLREGNNLMMMAGVNSQFKDELAKTRALDDFGAENVFLAQPGYGTAEDEALLAAQKWLDSHVDQPESAA